MAENEAPKMQATLGLTGLTMNAMALIAPGAFLWLTYFIQATTGVTGTLRVWLSRSPADIGTASHGATGTGSGPA